MNIWAGARCSIVPVVPLALVRAELEPAMHASRRAFTVSYKPRGNSTYQIPVSGCTARTCLRGYSLSNSATAWHFEHSGYLDGSQHIQLKVWNKSLGGGECLFFSWIMTIITDAMCVALDLSGRAENPSTEFAVEIQLRSNAPSHALMLDDESRRFQVGQPDLTLPRYSLIPEFGLPSLLTVVESDIFNALGLGYSREVDSIA